MVKVNKSKMTSIEEEQYLHLVAKDSLGELAGAEAKQYLETMAKYAYDDEKDPFEQWIDKAIELKTLHPELSIEQAKDQIATSNDWIRDHIDQ